MRFISYLIIVVISILIGISSRNSFDLINSKEVFTFADYLPKGDIELFGPIVDKIFADLES